MIRIAISGICGKMGKRIGVLAALDKDFEIAGALESQSNPSIGKSIGEALAIGEVTGKVESDFSKLTKECDVLIEFTAPEVTMEHLEEAIKKKIAVVIGTTAFSPRQIGSIKDASLKIPIVFSPNMSVGANLLFRITGIISETLGEDYEVEIIEAHHSQKKDAPSGTAKRLGEVVSKARGGNVPAIHSIREGDIVGDHTVIFASKGERIEITHRAYSRDAFAKGALDAAKFVKGKSPGLYTMHEVIKKER